MKFSIRDMFLVTFAVALALLVWRSGDILDQCGRNVDSAICRVAQTPKSNMDKALVSSSIPK